MARNVRTLSEILPWQYPLNDGNSSPTLGSRISLWLGDITKLALDAVGNAANHMLCNGAGVNGAIHRDAGTEALTAACMKLGGCPAGEARITPGFNLPAKHIIHCVGPVGQQKEVLHSTYTNALKLCSEHGLRSIAFPCISTGIYGYPNRPAAEVAIKAVLSYLKTNSDIDRVVFCCFLSEDHEIYADLIPQCLESFANEKE